MDRRYNLFSDIIYTKKLVYSKNYNNNYNIKNFSIMTWNLWGTPCYNKLSLLDKRFEFINYKFVLTFYIGKRMFEFLFPFI